tara:strand:- start:83 stop:595 length:513 start_codon:yes stop_codon:yes gene_type:complete
MKKLTLTTLAGIMLLSTQAFAQSFTVQGKVLSADAHYKTVNVNNPQQVCKIVDVPVYGNTGGTTLTGEQVLGAIIGGVIGSKIGKGTGNDIAIGTGAIIGSQIGKNNSQQKIVGYKQVQQCTTENNISQQTILSHYDLEVEAMGQVFTTRTVRGYSVGDNVTVDVNMSVR